MNERYKVSRLSSAEDLRAEFARRLLSRLRDLHMTQTDLARASGLSKDAVSTYVRQRSIPGPDNLRKIAEALKVDATELVPKGWDSHGQATQPLQYTMLDNERCHVRLDAELPIDAGTEIVRIVREAAAADAE